MAKSILRNNERPASGLQGALGAAGSVNGSDRARLARGHTAAERRGISGDLRKTFFSAYCSDEKVLLYGAGCEPAVPTWG